MTSLADGSPPMTIDLGRLAATIAFASETLATAAEALAEAAREILDASQALGGCRPIGTSSFMYSTDSDDGEPDKESRSETTDQESSGKGDPHGLGHGAETGAPPRIKIALDPGHRAETPHSQAHNQPSTINTPSEGENHANSCGDGGTLPLSSQPGQPSPSLVDDTATTARSQIDHAIKNEPSPPRLMDGQNNHYNRSYTQDKAVDITTPVLCNKSQPQRYVIRFGQDSGAVVFIAYMALRSNKTVCIISEQTTLMSSYAKALESITEFRVFHPIAPSCLRFTDPMVQSFIAYNSPAILLLSADQPLEIYHIGLYTDCVAYWGVPPNSRSYLRQFLACSPLDILSCLILTSGLGLDPSLYRMIEYPTDRLEEILGPNSPFNQVCETAGPILTRLGLGWSTPTYIPPVGGPSQAGTHTSPPQESPLPPISHRNTQSMPPGHYYILLEEMRDSDIIPLIAHIALNNPKVMCYLPGDKDLETYQKHINAIATVNTIIPPATGKARIKVGVDQLRANRYGVLLRSARGDLGQYLTLGLADCLIYCGSPSNPRSYARTFTSKFSHSYLILTDAQRAALPQLPPMNPPLRKHPTLQNLSGPVMGPILSDLRIRLVSSLRG